VPVNIWLTYAVINMLKDGHKRNHGEGDGDGYGDGDIVTVVERAREMKMDP
jgi:hypothetical protein